ncbi:MAG: YbaK/EbsC family protein [Ignavibacteriae bacterium]|nr:YbaK/EbsC family protein [Ignavibacteriota bacterium]MCB9207840.1 YbaK/EbsC family protein [Ignavibacteriales bacterium]MCB9258609.1 YbaK/EbsC family protein [Ignavibacteriales bacterium]
MPSKIIKDFLDQNNIKYVSVKHSKAYTAQEIAATVHIHGKQIAKTVVLKINGKLAFAVLPATYKVDFKLLKESLGTEDVRLANEPEFKDKCPGCEVGAMPPMGNLFNMDTYVAASLVEDEEIAFNAGSHTELIRMNYLDYEKLVKPKILRFANKYKT